ncbi:diguanylate cyclase domain-containing protein [Piscinibacter sakaiensis]|uniref:GGDEF domain-containing response regulator n=1 Tax=Piscinibacter sakaiensis TaxID=1547922 RepID=UPI003AAEB0D5
MTDLRDDSRKNPTTVSILVVDDSENLLQTMHDFLAQPDVEVLTANSAVAAQKLLADQDVALALIDVRMPEINGYQLAEWMRSNEQTRSVPIIFITGESDVLARKFIGYGAGAVDFLSKPTDPRVLHSKVQVFVELYRQRQALRERNAELERMVQANQELAMALREAHSEALQQAHTDSLTGVSNRRHIMNLAESALLDRRRQSQPLSLAILDLDHFKAVNDTYGHHIGDAVLCAFCKHVNQQIRPPHMLGRLGGEEFLLLMPGTSLAEADTVLERVRRTLQPADSVPYTFSGGIAQAGAGEPLALVIERADSALYHAKRSGRDCSVTRPAPL